MFGALLALDSTQISELANFYGGVGQSLTPVWVYVSSFLILVVITVALVGFGRFMGYGPFIALISAFYIGYALFAAFPYGSYLPSAPALTAVGTQVGLYLAFTIASYIILRKVAASDFIHMGSVGLILISFLTAGFLMALAYQSFSVRSVYHFTPSLDQLFAAKEWFFAWFVAPFVGLFIFAKTRGA